MRVGTKAAGHMANTNRWWALADHLEEFPTSWEVKIKDKDGKEITEKDALKKWETHCAAEQSIARKQIVQQGKSAAKRSQKRASKSS